MIWPVMNCDLGGTGGNYWCGALPSASQIPPENISIYTVMDPLIVGEIVNNAGGSDILPFDPSYLDHFGFRGEVHNVNLRTDYEADNGWTFGTIAAYSESKQMRLNTTGGRDTSNIRN